MRLRSKSSATSSQRTANLAADEASWVARRFPSWREHAGVVILAVGLLNGMLVVTGFGITWFSTLKRYELDSRAQRLKSQLERTNQQLETLFGPVAAFTHATGAGYRSFVANLRGNRDIEAYISAHPHSTEAEQYRQLLRCRLQPMNRRVMELVLQNTHLIDGEFPDCLYDIYAHVIEMDLLLERWAQKDYSVMFPRTPYPKALNGWAGREFERLRQRQLSLLSALHPIDGDRLLGQELGQQ